MIMLFLLVPSLTEALCICNPPAPPHSARRLQRCPTFLRDAATPVSSSAASGVEAAGGASGHFVLEAHGRPRVVELCTHQHARPCSLQGQVNTCVLAWGALLLCTGEVLQPESGIAVRGRGVSVQAAGYLIVLPLLRPFPSALPSSQLQWEVSRGRAGPSLYHYPSITCHPPTLCWQQNFPPSPFSPRSHRRLRPFVISHPLSFSSFMIFTSFYSPSVPSVSLPDWPFYLSLFTFLVVSCIFFHISLGNSGFCHSETFCWGCSWLLERQRTPTAAFADQFLSHEELCRILSQREA